MIAAEPMAHDDEQLAWLRKLNARFIHNFVTNDVASHDAILHRDFLAVMSDGSRMGRAAYLRRWANAFDPAIIVYWDYRDELITIAGDVALVRATNKHTIRRGGTDTTGMTTYTDTYVREDGAWLCIQAQLTPVACGAEPGDATIVRVYLEGIAQPG